MSTSTRQASWTMIFNQTHQKSRAYTVLVGVIAHFLEQFKTQSAVDISAWSSTLLARLADDYMLVPVPKVYINLGIPYGLQNKNPLQWHRHPLARISEVRRSELFNRISVKIRQIVEESMPRILNGNMQSVAERILNELANEYLLYPHEISPLKSLPVEE